jgi:hypothetical protein
MIINDLSHIEVANQAQNIQGGGGKKYGKGDIFAFADSEADAYAKGKKFAATEVSTYTSTNTKGYASSYSGAYSSSVSN